MLDARSGDRMRDGAVRHRGLAGGRGEFALPGARPTFDAQFANLFQAHFQSLFRYLNRLSGETDNAADLAQETFVRLYRRGSLPDAPKAWLITVAMNLLRNARTTNSRRLRLMPRIEAEWAARSTPPSPETLTVRDEERGRVRAAIDRMAERERQLLLLHAEGCSYREIAAVLHLNVASVGTLLARARREFRALYDGGVDAPR
jgi:RNA polymerase sigma factor (sigma-70 family)